MKRIDVLLRMRTGEYQRDAAAASGATRKLGDSGKAAAVDLDKLSLGLGIAGAALTAVAAAVVITAAKFDKQMSEVAAVTGATADEMDKLRQAAVDAGAETVFSATESAQAIAELAKAGIATADILGGALRGSLDLAAAGSLDLAQAAEIAAAAMNTFDLKGTDVAHIADVLAAAANKSAAGVEDLGQGIQQVGLIAAQVGFTLDETVGLLAAFADYGLKGSDGATSLKTALLRLAAPTGGAAELMKDLGIAAYDASGNFKSASDIAGNLQDALKDMAPAQRNAALNTIFGSDAIRAANILYSEGAQGIQDYVAAVDDQGAASEVAAKKLDNLAGDFQKLMGSLESLALTGSGGATDGLRFLAQSADRVVNAIGNLPAPVLEIATIIAGVGGASLLAAAGALKLKSTMDDVIQGFGKGTKGATRMGKAVGTIGSVAGKAGIAIAALALASEGLDRLGWLDKIPILNDLFGSTDNHLNEMKTSAGQLARENTILNSTIDAQVAELGSLVDLWESLNGLVATSDSEMLEAKESIADLTETFKENKHAIEGNSLAALRNRVALEGAAKEAFEAADAYLKQTGDAEGAAKMLEQFREDAIKATGATGKQKEAIEKLAAELFRLPTGKNVTVNVAISKSSLDKLKFQVAAALGGNTGFFGFRYGGVVEHAQSGLLRQATTFAAGSSPLYGFAEPGTGGEAFIPKNGNYGRSMGILSQAAGWYGADVVPRGGWYGGGGGGATTVDVSLTISGGDRLTRAIAENTRTEVRTKFAGSVQAAYGPRRR